MLFDNIYGLYVFEVLLDLCIIYCISSKCNVIFYEGILGGEFCLMLVCGVKSRDF